MPPRRRVKPRAVHVKTPSAGYAQLHAAFLAQNPTPVPATLPTGTGVVPAPTTSTGLGGATGTSGTAATTTSTNGPLGGISDFVTQKLPAYFKIGTGGLIVIVSGLALVYVAGRNTAPVQAAKLVTNPIKGATKGATRTVAKAPAKAATVPDRPDVVRGPSASGKPKLRLVEPAKAPAKATTTINLRNASPEKRAQVRKMMEAG